MKPTRAPRHIRTDNGLEYVFKALLRWREWSRSQREATVDIKDWRRSYNEVRPHSSFGKVTPRVFARMIDNNSTPGATLKN